MTAVSREVRERLATLAAFPTTNSWPYVTVPQAMLAGLLADLEAAEHRAETLREHLTQVLNGIDWLDELAPPRAPSAAYANREAGLAVFRCNARDFLAEYDGATEATS